MGFGEQLHSLRADAVRPLKRFRSLLAWRRLNFAGVPVIFGNAMPKSGSHLLRQILEGMCRIGPFVDTGRRPVRTITLDGRLRSVDEILGDLRRLRPGDVGSGYLRATPEIIDALCRPDWAVYFIIRDPRDMLVSHVYYATEMYPGHGMHRLYKSLPDHAARLKVAIQGIHEDGFDMAGVAERYRRITGWISCPEVMTVHFEDLILDQQNTLAAMLDHLEGTGYQLTIDRSMALEKVIAAINPQKSPTFRKGKVGGWDAYFGDEHKALFKELTGDLLIQLGYEENNDW